MCAELLLLLLLWLPSNDVGTVSVLKLPLWTLNATEERHQDCCFLLLPFCGSAIHKRGSKGDVWPTEIYQTTEQEEELGRVLDRLLRVPVPMQESILPKPFLTDVC